MARERLLLDYGWRFHLGHAADMHLDFNHGTGKPFAKAGEFTGAASTKFDDSNWRGVDLPHDWAVELPFDPTCLETCGNGFKPVHRTRPATSVGWYRRRFELAPADAGRRIGIEFDGVFRDCLVWLNGHYLGRHLSGYMGFQFDVSDYVEFDKPNVLVLRVDAALPEGWFYEGAGIYRHTWLTKTDPVHVPIWGHFVTATPRDIDGDAAASADVTVQTEVVNDSDRPAQVTVESVILAPRGRKVGGVTTPRRRLGPWARATFTQKLRLSRAALWSIERPALHQALTTVRVAGRVVDSVRTTFGIREFRFDADKGFFLNGQSVKIKGVCCHQDHAGVGAAVPDAVQAFRVRRLKEMGVNAYRTSHNPPTPELLEECDRQGMLVMDEIRLPGTTPEVLGDFASLLRRDRNHPSVILWSIGNEEHTIQGTDVGRRIGTVMKRLARRLDPTRPICAAMNNGGAGVGFVEVEDVHGWNYINIGDVDAWHRKHPKVPIVGSEEASTLCTRGIYERDAARGYVTAYDQEAPSWGRPAEGWWKFYAERPWLAGGFIWTGFDYRGEPTPYRWPCINSHFGVLDTCGFPKDNFHYYQAWWTDRPVLHLLPHWNWLGREGQPIDVRCFTNADEVELFLNGRSRGKRAVPRNGHVRWDVLYEPGTLLARAYRAGKLWREHKVETTGGPAAVRLTPDRPQLRADNHDAAVVEVAVLDHARRLVPTADNEVRFQVSDNARIIGVGNGDPSSHAPDKADRRRAFHGLCQVIVQATRRSGTITLMARSPGLRPARITLRAGRVAPPPFVP